MIRRFDQRPVPADVVDRILDLARRSPTAGFAQGVDFLVLDTPASIGAFWRLTANPAFPPHPEEVAIGSSTTRERRPFGEQIHRNRW